MITKEMTYKEISEHPLLKDLAPYFITKMDLSAQPHYTKTLDEFHKAGGWNADAIVFGLNRLCRNLEAGHCRFPLYTEEEITADPDKKDPFLLFFPSEDPKADERPWILVAPGGAYINVWSLTEGYPVAARFNDLGYHAFVINYRVSIDSLFPRPLEDIARALTVIRDPKNAFPVQWDNYVAVGFSAGANLICNWTLRDHGYPVYGMPEAKVLLPIYAPISFHDPEEETGTEEPDEDEDWFARYAFGLTNDEVIAAGWSIEDHVEGFPPTFLCCCADDDLVDPENSRIMKRALDAAGIPCELEIHAHGGHGFADGRNTDAAGWIDRAVQFIQAHI